MRITPQPPRPGFPLQAPSACISTTGSVIAPRGAVLPAGAVLLRNRGKRAPARALLPPGRGDDAHAVDALHRAHDVDAAHDRPPALAGLFHELEALEPLRVGEGRRIAAETPPVQLEAEQVQPILESQEADV